MKLDLELLKKIGKETAKTEEFQKQKEIAEKYAKKEEKLHNSKLAKVATYGTGAAFIGGAINLGLNLEEQNPGDLLLFTGVIPCMVGLVTYEHNVVMKHIYAEGKMGWMVRNNYLKEYMINEYMAEGLNKTQAEVKLAQANWDQLNEELNKAIAHYNIENEQGFNFLDYTVEEENEMLEEQVDEQEFDTVEEDSDSMDM